MNARSALLFVAMAVGCGARTGLESASGSDDGTPESRCEASRALSLRGVPERIAVDGVGRTYVTGEFSGTSRFGTEEFTADGSSDVFIAAYAPGGEVLWTETVSSPARDTSGDVAVMGDEVWVVANEGFPADVGVIQRFDASGTRTLLLRIPLAQLASVAPAPEGAYVTGTGPVPALGLSDNTVFLLALGSDGAQRWLVNVEGFCDPTPCGNRGTWARVLDDGGVAWSGTTTGGLGHLSPTPGARADDSGFVAVYESDGTLRWSRVFAGGQQFLREPDSSDVIGVAGQLRGTTSVGGRTLTAPDDGAPFAVVFDASGDIIFARVSTGAGMTARIAFEESGDAWIHEHARFDGSGSLGHYASDGGSFRLTREIPVTGQITSFDLEHAVGCVHLGLRARGTIRAGDLTVPTGAPGEDHVVTLRP